jgi:hypothetical protein
MVWRKSSRQFVILRPGTWRDQEQYSHFGKPCLSHAAVIGKSKNLKTLKNHVGPCILYEMGSICIESSFTMCYYTLPTRTRHLEIVTQAFNVKFTIYVYTGPTRMSLSIYMKRLLMNQWVSQIQLAEECRFWISEPLRLQSRRHSLDSKEVKLELILVTRDQWEIRTVGT